jgi:hypothetical protein
MPNVHQKQARHVSDIPTHRRSGARNKSDQREQGDVYLKLPDNSQLASVIGSRELVIDVSRMSTHDKHGHGVPPSPLSGTSRHS